MAKIQTRPWDVAEHLETDEDMTAYLEAALEAGDPALVAAAMGNIARAKGMAQIARERGLGRESLYKALSPAGNPEFATVLKVMRVLGLRLRATPVPLNCLPLATTKHLRRGLIQFSGMDILPFPLTSYKAERPN
jgi:probable addiction module antidote protein